MSHLISPWIRAIRRGPSLGWVGAMSSTVNNLLLRGGGDRHSFCPDVEKSIYKIILVLKDQKVVTNYLKYYCTKICEVTNDYFLMSSMYPNYGIRANVI